MEKYTFTTKLHLVCGDDELRPIFNLVHFKNGMAYASNGSALIRQSIEYHMIINPEKLNGKSIHKDSYKAIMSFEFATCDDKGIECKSKDGVVAYFEYFDMKDKKLPDFDSVIPVSTKIEPVKFIGINPNHLANVFKAMHAPGGHVRMRFCGIDKAILIDAPDIPFQQAIVLPVILNDTLF